MFRQVGQRTEVEQRLPREYAHMAANHPVQVDRTLTGMSNANRLLHLRVDLPLLLVVISLLVIGLVMVFSASYDYSRVINDGDPYKTFSRQVIWVILGIIGAIVLAFLDYRWWRRLSVPALLITILMLVGVLFVNEVRNNAVRTFYEGSIQPSELAKLVTVIYLGVWLTAKREQLSDITFGLIPLAAILGILGGLIFIQPDLSAAVTIIILGSLMFFLAGGDLKQIAILLAIALIVGWIIVQVNPTGSDRVKDYLLGLRDPTQASYHVRRSLEAFLRGGWFGVGIGKSETKVTGLPVPPTDSIFAVVGEETGFFGSALLVALFSLLLWRSLKIAAHAPDELGTLMSAGLGIWIALEAMINMAVMVNLVPFAGNAMPLISYGGSSMVMNMAAIGILLNISRQAVQTKEEKGKLREVVSLRRWDRRRRVPRASRPAGTDAKN